MTTLGTAFIDPNRQAMFHRQKLQLRRGFQCQEFITREFGGPQSGELVALNDVLTRADFSVVWINPQHGIEGVKLALRAGKHVLSDLPVFVSAEDWRALAELQGETGASIFVAAGHRWDSHFLTVRSQITAGGLGALTELTRISRQFIPGEMGLGISSTATSQPGVAQRIQQWEQQSGELKWFEILDELLSLVDQPVETVKTRAFGSGRGVWVRFVNGCQAHLELHRNSLAPLETGWVLEGSLGGFVNGRWYRAGADQELIDVPVEKVPTSQDAVYDCLEETLRSGRPFPITSESILNVLRLREAIASTRSL